MIVDPFAEHQDTLLSGARAMVLVTPDDDIDLAVQPRALYFADAGTVAVHMLNENGVSALVAVPVRSFQTLDIRPTRVLETGTDVTVFALW
ncbi:MAG: hypothetical protein R2770_09180 [Acidimicrobiales bacterium]